MGGSNFTTRLAVELGSKIEVGIDIHCQWNFQYVTNI